MSAFSNMAELINPNNEDLGLEAIEFQVDTSFAEKICAVYQDIINYRETCRGDKRIVKKVLEYADNKMSNEFPKLWKQYLGITLNHISLSNTVTFLFAMQPQMGSDRELAKVIDAMTGNALYATTIDFTNKTYEEIKKISMGFDRKTGRANVTKFLANNISMNFYFDPYVAFLIKDTLNIHFEYFTAEELTAVTLHEVGHMMSLIEHCGDTFFQVSLNAKIINAMKSAPVSEKIKMVKDIVKNKDAAKDLAGGSKLKPNEADAAIQTAKNMADNFQKDDNWNDSSWSFWNTIVNFFTACTSIALYLLSCVYNPINQLIIIAIQNLGIAWTRDYVQAGGRNEPKYSDFMANKTVAFNWERWADEYVTRFGYGSHLNNGLNKLILAMNKSSLFTGMNEKGVDTWIRNSWVALSLNYMVSISFALIMGGNTDDGFGIYESQIDRAKRVIQDTANVFKRMDLPQEVMDHYILEFEKCKKSVDNIPMIRRCEHLFALVHRCIMSFADPIQLGNRLLRGNIKAEYAELANDIDELNSNQLYYHAAKLNNILAKKG